MRALARDVGSDSDTIVIAPHKSLRTTRFVHSMKPLRSVAFRDAVFSWLYDERVPYPPTGHYADKVLALLNGVPDAQQWTKEQVGPIALHTDDDRRRALALVPFDAHGAVVLAPGSVWPTKRWPAASFAEVADRLQQEGYGAVVMLGGPDEQADVAAVRERMKTSVIDLAGATTVGLLPALLSKASLLITNDSGPMHVAAAIGTPVVALFGPTSAVLTGPYGAGHSVLTGNVPCRPCFSRTCSNALPLECLQTVSPEQVLAAVRAERSLRMVPR
jgi:lipopolysaccharide heptosyltransferase II